MEIRLLSSRGSPKLGKCYASIISKDDGVEIKAKSGFVAEKGTGKTYRMCK